MRDIHDISFKEYMKEKSRLPAIEGANKEKDTIETERAGREAKKHGYKKKHSDAIRNEDL